MRGFERLFLETKKDFWVDITVPLAINQDPLKKLFYTSNATDIVDSSLTTELLLASEKIEIVHGNEELNSKVSDDSEPSFHRLAHQIM